MKRSVVALGILGLVYAVLLPGASAQTTLLKDDFSTDALLKSPATYIQGRGTNIENDPTIPPFYVRDGKLTSDPPDNIGSASDGTGADHANDDPPPVQYLLLTGDKSWADVAIQARVYSDMQNNGQFALILRAAPKTKPADPNTWYEFTYTTNTTETGEVAPTNELLTPDQAASGIPAPGVVPDLRIIKVVKNKCTILAETDHLKSPIHIPAVNQGGVDHDTNHDGSGTPTGAYFRFVAKGNVLEAFCSLDGVKFDKYLSVTDNELTAGLVGLTHCEYSPVFDDLLVTTAP